MHLATVEAIHRAFQGQTLAVAVSYSSPKVCGWGGGSCEGGRRRVRRVGVAHPVEEGVGV